LTMFSAILAGHLAPAAPQHGKMRLPVKRQALLSGAPSPSSASFPLAMPGRDNRGNQTNRHDKGGVRC
jgi:hypothetical protein